MSTETSGVKEKELTGMTKRDIRQFIINLDEEDPDEYKAQAEDLYEAGVTGAALLVGMEKGDDAFVEELMKDFGFKKYFVRTMLQRLKEKLRREQPAKRRKLPVTKVEELSEQISIDNPPEEGKFFVVSGLHTAGLRQAPENGKSDCMGGRKSSSFGLFWGKSANSK